MIDDRGTIVQQDEGATRDTGALSSRAAPPLALDDPVADLGSATAGDVGEGSSDPHLATLEELTRLLLEEASLEQLLEQVLELTARALQTSVAVSVTVVEDDGTYTTVARSHDDAEAVDALQYRLVEGPCVDALEQQEERYSVDLVADERWPEIARRATELGFRCVLAVPLVVNGAAVGALNVFGDEVAGLDAGDRELARRIAAPAATTLANARAYRRVSRLAEQLQEALDSRAVIERAKGVIMLREGCDADGAFDRLRRASQDSNRKLRDLARDVVDATAARSLPDDEG